MAIIYQNPNGIIKGTIGPLYAKYVKGRNIFCIRPVPTGRLYDTMTDVYQRWRTTVRFCKGLSKITPLKKLNEKIRGNFFSGYNALISKNNGKCGLTAPTENNTIVVDGFSIVMSNINLTETAVTATVPALNTLTYIPEGGVDVRFLGSIVYSDPVEAEKDPPFLVTPVDKTVAAYNFAAQYSFSQNLDAVQLNLGARYQRKIVYLLASVTDADGTYLVNSQSASAVL